MYIAKYNIWRLIFFYQTLSSGHHFDNFTVACSWVFKFDFQVDFFLPLFSFIFKSRVGIWESYTDIFTFWESNNTHGNITCYEREKIIVASHANSILLDGKLSSIHIKILNFIIKNYKHLNHESLIKLLISMISQRYKMP
jgi:hypothetical protein